MKRSVLYFLLTVFAFLLLSFPSYGALISPSVIQGTDFLTAFYIAGKLAWTGQSAILYPQASDTSFLSTAFNTYAHETLPYFPKELVAIYLHPPLVAYLLQPLGGLSPQMAFIAMQAASILSLCVCIKLFTLLANKHWSVYFLSCIVFFPILHTLVINQIGIVFGLLPLSVGYWCLMRHRPWLAGLCWSLLLLKLQFFPLVLLLVSALAIARQTRPVLAFVIGITSLAIGNLVCFGPQVAHQWLHSLQLGDAIFTYPEIYHYNERLIASLPAAILQVVPTDWRHTAKLLLYLSSFAIALHSLFYCRALIKASNDYLSAIPYVFVLGCLILPLVLPYCFIYDLSVLALAGMVVAGSGLINSKDSLPRYLLLCWLFIDLYLVSLMFVQAGPIQPLTLVAVLTTVYVWSLKRMREQLHPLKN